MDGHAIYETKPPTVTRRIRCGACRGSQLTNTVIDISTSSNSGDDSCRFLTGKISITTHPQSCCPKSHDIPFSPFSFHLQESDRLQFPVTADLSIEPHCTASGIPEKKECRAQQQQIVTIKQVYYLYDTVKQMLPTDVSLLDTDTSLPPPPLFTAYLPATSILLR